jgi:hypothetical protein
MILEESIFTNTYHLDIYTLTNCHSGQPFN